MNFRSGATQNIMALLGGVILAVVVLYYLFVAVDRYGLTEQKGTATVVDKYFRAGGKTYRTEYIGSRSIVIPQMRPDMYILRLRVGEKETEFTVSKELHDSINTGDTLESTYQRRRITGSVQITGVTR